MKTEILFCPTEPAFHDRVHDAFREMRDQHPVYQDPAGDFFALSRYEDVRFAAESPAIFSSEGTSLGKGLFPHLQILDPPVHDRLRGLVSKAFTPRCVADIEPRARAIARELIDAIEVREEADLLADFSRHLPNRVISDVIGVPPERRRDFLEWTEAMVAIDPDASQAETVQSPAMRIYAEFERLLDERRKQPQDDLMSALINTEIDGRKLTQEELLGFCFLLIVAGNDTTMNLIANGAVLLARHPETRRELVKDPAKIPLAIEEMLRYESPSYSLPRTLTRDVELHETVLPAGSEVLLLWGSANRDEREFEHPDRFDIHRSRNRHLAFGIGRHFCLGAHLARLEARVAFEELLSRVPDYQLREEPAWLTSVWARAHATVPVWPGLRAA